MAVKVNDADRTICTVDAAEEWKGDGVVTTESDHSRKCLALLRPALHICIGLGSSSEKLIMAFFDLLKSIGVVVSSSGMN